ncbi:hypothetical protein L195_g050193, partial [Trifolium pratense]
MLMKLLEMCNKIITMDKIIWPAWSKPYLHKTALTLVYIGQTELPRGWKIPRFTKFAGDTSESTVEHISRISLKELSGVRRKTSKSIDDYLNRFRVLKARCFTQVSEHELVEMTAGGLDYYIRKKLDTRHLRDMAQLADRVQQVERLKIEKARTSKFQKKEKVAYVETYEDDNEYEINHEDITESE